MAIQPAFDALTAATPSESVDVLVTWIGGVTLVRYRLAIGHGRTAGPLERRARVLVSVVAILLIVRGFSWLWPDTSWLGTFIQLPATLLPFAMTLFAEGLLRRHVPLWIKVLSVAATLAALATVLGAALIGAQDSATASYMLLASLLAVMTALFIEMARRDVTSLSRAENAIVRAMLVVAIISVPLITTDFRFVFGWPPARLGTLAALLFCYTLLRRPDERGFLRRWSRALLRLVLRAALVCALLLVALRTAPRDLLFPLFVLATALVLALAVNDRLGAAAARGSDRSLLRWLARPPAESLTAFMRELRHLPLTADAIVMDAQELTAYHVPAILAAFTSATLVRARVDLRNETRASTARSLGADELSDLLERNGMSHVALLSETPLRLLLANIPELPGAADSETALAAIVRHGRMALLDDGAAPGAPT